MGEGSEAERAITAALGVLAEPGRSMQAIPSRELRWRVRSCYQFAATRGAAQTAAVMMPVMLLFLACIAAMGALTSASTVGFAVSCAVAALGLAAGAFWFIGSWPEMFAWLPASRVTRVRAGMGGLDLLVEGCWQSHAWREVARPRRLKVQPCDWGDEVWHLRVGREHVYVPVEGVNASLGEAAKVARRHHRHLPETTHGASDAALSPAERMRGEDEDRGLSKADA